jgi:four helix bundle protein
METAQFVPSHERLIVWQKAMRLVVASYRVALLLPGFDRYGLASQIRRAAISIPANIAEGCGRTGCRDRLRFLSIARSSLCELRTLLAAVSMLEYMEPAQLSEALQLITEVERPLHGLRKLVASKR